MNAKQITIKRGELASEKLKPYAPCYYKVPVRATCADCDQPATIVTIVPAEDEGPKCLCNDCVDFFWMSKAREIEVTFEERF